MLLQAGAPFAPVQRASGDCWRGMLSGPSRRAVPARSRVAAAAHPII